MYCTELGSSDCPTIILLHGAFFVDAFGKQYPLSSRYHLVIPHIKGFGKAAGETFTAEAAAAELRDFIARRPEPVDLIGFSLGAQLAFKLLCEDPALFRKAILVSPCLLPREELRDEMLQANLKMLRSLKREFSCNLIGLMNGLPRPARREFVRSMQLVSEATVRNCVDNGISLDSVRSFSACPVPSLALAGSREAAPVRDSVQRLAEMNPRCRCEIWDKAGHNIPPRFARRFNDTILNFFTAD
ncbi:MAG: alpha/beta hydrolase [Firmicutes bacterium]|nr:alpha/beta hydrolase [Bacillota bacterium]